MRIFTIIILIGLAIISCLDQASGVVLRASKDFDFNNDDYNDGDNFNWWSNEDESDEYDDHDNHQSNGALKIMRKYAAQQGLGSGRSSSSNFGQSRRISGADSQTQESSSYTNGGYGDRSDRYSEGGQYGNVDDDNFDQSDRSMRYSRGQNSRNRMERYNGPNDNSRYGMSRSRRRSSYTNRGYGDRSDRYNEGGQYGNVVDDNFDQNDRSMRYSRGQNSRNRMERYNGPNDNSRYGMSRSRRRYNTRGYRSGRYGNSGDGRVDQYEARGYRRFRESGGGQLNQYDTDGYRDYYGGQMDQYGGGGGGVYVDEVEDDGGFGDSDDGQLDQYETGGYRKYDDGHLDHYGAGGYRDYYGGHSTGGYGEYSGEQYGENGLYDDSSRTGRFYGGRYGSRYGSLDATADRYNRVSGMRQREYEVDRDGYDDTLSNSGKGRRGRRYGSTRSAHRRRYKGKISGRRARRGGRRIRPEGRSTSGLYMDY